MASRTASAGLWSLPLFFLAAGASDAGACDSSSCVLVTRGQGGALAKGAFAVDLSFRYTDESARLSGSAPTEDVIRPRIDFDGQRLLPGFHREIDGSMNSLQADLAYGVTGRLTALASLPLFSRKAFEHAHVASTPAAPGTTPEDDPHGHGGPAAAEPSVPREYRTDGFGDTLLGLRYAVWGAGPRRLSAGLVVKLPTGESRLPNPYDGGLHDPTLQPGTGAMDYGLSVQYAHAAGPLQWTASSTQQFATGKRPRLSLRPRDDRGRGAHAHSARGLQPLAGGRLGAGEGPRAREQLLPGGGRARHRRADGHPFAGPAPDHAGRHGLLRLPPVARVPLRERRAARDPLVHPHRDIESVLKPLRELKQPTTRIRQA